MSRGGGDGRFATRFGSAMALVGVSVGLANVWRFPYMAGQHGGGAFVLLYAFFVIALGAPALVAEWSLGRLTRRGPGTAFRSVGIPGGRAIGALLFLTVFMATSYYTVIVGQVLHYALAGGVPSGGGSAEAAYVARFGGITVWNVVCSAGVLAAMGSVLALGVRRGIERVSRVAIPVIGVALVAAAVRAMTLPGAFEGVRFFLAPDFSMLDGRAVLAALGQAFFSLSLGGTFFLTYGSYLRSKDDLPRLAASTVAGDTGAAMLGGLAVLPAAFAFGVAPAAGPPLLFVTLPQVFAEMPGGAAFGTVFFSTLFLAAFLSALAGLEVCVNVLSEWTGWSRRRLALILVVVELGLALPSMHSVVFLAWSDLLWGSTMQPVGSALTLLALGFFVSRGRALAEAGRGAKRPPGSLWLFWVRFVIPASIVVVLVAGWWEQLGSLLG